MSPGHTYLKGSFIQSAIPVESDLTVASTSSQPPHLQEKSDSILALLQRLDKSKHALIKPVSDLESQKSVNATAKKPQPQLDGNTSTIQSNVHSLTPVLYNGTQLTGLGAQVNAM